MLGLRDTFYQVCSDQSDSQWAISTPSCTPTLMEANCFDNFLCNLSYHDISFHCCIAITFDYWFLWFYCRLNWELLQIINSNFTWSLTIMTSLSVMCLLSSRPLPVFTLRCYFLFLLLANCHVPGQPGLTGRDDTCDTILASDWSIVRDPGSWLVKCHPSDACQTWRLLSVMYRPLRRHTYHSVTNNTNN